MSSMGQPSFHVLFILVIVALFLAFSWYMTYESTLEGMRDQLNMVLILCPVMLLLIVHWLSVVEKPTLPLPRSEPNAIHRAGGSPWGVGLLVLVLMVMISYQSSFHDSWFPMFTRG
uniref:Transmembrane protein n=1 Tax=Picea sitchensis TaxID=3332 RepID=A9NMH4_PICSI|nr:unknown [Picea sitchensis]